MSWIPSPEADADSPVHRWDPRWRIGAIVCLMAGISFTREPLCAAAGLGLAVLVFLWARLPLNGAWKRLRWLLLFLVPFGLFFLLLGPRPDVSWVGLSLSKTGLHQTALLFAKATGILLLTLPAFETSPFDRTLRALSGLGLPKKLVLFFGFTYRYLFLFLDDLARLRLATRARGFTPALNRRSLTTLSGLLGNLILRSFDRTETIHRAMQARGFEEEMPVGDASFRTGVGDILKAAVLLAATGCLVYWDGTRRGIW